MKGNKKIKPIKMEWGSNGIIKCDGKIHHYSWEEFYPCNKRCKDDWIWWKIAKNIEIPNWIWKKFPVLSIFQKSFELEDEGKTYFWNSESGWRRKPAVEFRRKLLDKILAGEKIEIKEVK